MFFFHTKMQQMMDTQYDKLIEVFKDSSTTNKQILYDVQEQFEKQSVRYLQEIEKVVELFNEYKNISNSLFKVIDERLTCIEQQLDVVCKCEEDIENKKEIVNNIGKRTCDIERKLDQLRNAQNIIWNDKACLYYDSYNIEKKYDVGFIGMISSANYGASLVLYSLAFEIKQMGYSIIVLDIPEIAGGELQYSEENPNRKFIKKHFHITPMLHNNQLKVLNNVCNCFVYGADSLWGGGYEHQLYNLEGAMFGEFVDDGKGLVAFSTSFGAWNPQVDNSCERKYVSTLMKRFGHISVREKQSVDMCKKVFDIDATWTIDPVFFHDRFFYLDVSEDVEKINDQKYIFAYILEPKKNKLELIKSIARQLNIKVFFVPDLTRSNISSEDRYDIYDFDVLEKITIEQWITCINKSEYVITDSFHGFCFSVIFHKHFATLKPRDSMQRIMTVAEYLKLEDFVGIDSDENMWNALNSDIDYSIIDKKISEKVLKDKNELRESLQKAMNKEKNIKNNIINQSSLKEKILYNRALKKLG